MAEVASAVGMAELADDPRFITQAKRAQNQQELVALLAPLFKLRPAAEWLAEMDRRQVPCAPINDFADILHDPHVAHMGLVKTNRIAKWRGYKNSWVSSVYQRHSSRQIFSHPRRLALIIKLFLMSGLGQSKVSQTMPDK